MLIRKLLIALVLASVGSFAFAGKVAVFNHEYAVVKTKRAVAAFQALEKNAEFAQLAAQFEALRADLQAMQKEQETKGMTWSNEQVAEHTRKQKYVLEDYQLAGKKLQTEKKAVLDRVMQDVGPKLEAAIKKIVDSEGIDVLLQQGAIYYANPSVDITDKVAAELDKVL